MKTKWVATQNARKMIAVFQNIISWGTVLFITTLFLFISCAKSDDLDIMNNELTTNNESLIIYTDITPDFASKNIGDFYNLDLNNDGTENFRLESIIGCTWCFWVAPNKNGGNVAFVAVSGSFESYIVPLNKDHVISKELGSHLFYDSYGGYIVMEFCDTAPYYCSYSWEGRMDKYLGLRFLIKGQPHYGWVRLDVTSPTEWIIKDYAYNTTPGNPILAGQKT